MFQTACRHSIADGSCRIIHIVGVQSKDQPCAEGIAASETVHDIADLVGRIHAIGKRCKKFCIIGFIVKHPAPVVVVGRIAFTECDRHKRGFRERRTQFAGDFAVAFDIDLAGFHAGAFRSDPEHILRIFFIADDDVRIRHDLFHALARKLFGCDAFATPFPQFFAEIQVAGDPDPLFRCLLHNGKGGKIGIFAQCRSDPGHMKVRHTVQHGIKIVIFRFQQRDHGIGAVVQHIGAALCGTVFRIIHTHSAVFRITDLFHIRAESALLCGKCSRKKVIRQSRQITGFSAHHGNGGTHIGFAAAVGDFQLTGQNLCKTQFSGGRDTHHDFTETGDDLLIGHDKKPFIKLS